MRLTRRRLLAGGGALAGLAALGLARAAEDAGRQIELYNLHTDEHLSTTFWQDGGYDVDALGRIENLLRDFRTNERHRIDPKLLDYLTRVAAALGKAPKFSVISGYRSPETNQRLHARSSGVSQHSLHMQGRAMDVRLAGVDCAKLAGRAVELELGGVGYYRASDFVHLDTGAFRTWRG